MKKGLRFLVLLVICLTTMLLAGCGNDQKYISLEEAIGDLQTNVEEINQEKEELNDQIEDLLAQIEKLEKNLDNKNSIISSLRTSVEEATEKVKELEDKIIAINEGINVQLADEYTLVVGDNFQLFYRSIVQAPDPYGYYIKLEGKKGHAFNRYYEFSPTKDDIGTHSLKVSVCDANGKEYGSDTTKLIVVDNKATNDKEKTILCFGDSLTYNGVWVAQGISKYVASGGTNIKTIGSMTKELNGVTVNYEGNSGWQWSTYVNGSTDKDTPFRSTSQSNKISFKEYAQKYNVKTIDEIYILLTWNGISGRLKEFSFEDSLFSNAKTIIDQFHSDFPEGKVTLIGIPKPSMNAGLGSYYEINYGYGDNYGQSVTVMNYNQFMEDWCKMEEYSNFMTYVDGMGQFDSEYNMPTEGKPVNNQNNTTEQIGNAMGMHPTNNGYMQIGDTFYRALMNNK